MQTSTSGFTFIFVFTCIFDFFYSYFIFITWLLNDIISRLANFTVLNAETQASKIIRYTCLVL